MSGFLLGHPALRFWRQPCAGCGEEVGYDETVTVVFDKSGPVLRPVKYHEGCASPELRVVE